MRSPSSAPPPPPEAAVPYLPSLKVMRLKHPSAKRIEGVSVSRSICYGSMAFWLGKGANEFHSHRWTIYLRGLQCEDLSYFISKVVFSLHPDFNESERVVEKPPFEVTETGWGEFNVGIRIIFTDPTLPHVDLIQPLKLYPPNNQGLSTKKPVVHEFYDELVFNDPTEAFYKTLMAGPQMELPRHPLTDHFGAFNEIADLQRLQAAQAYVSAELARCRAHLTDGAGRLVRNEALKMLPEDFGQSKKSRRKANAEKAKGEKQASAAAAAAAAAAATAASTEKELVAERQMVIAAGGKININNIIKSSKKHS